MLVRRCGLGVPFEAATQLQRAQFAQLRWQRRQGHLADGPLVVTGTECHQLPPGCIQRGNAVKNASQGSNLVGLRRIRRLGLVGRVPYQPQQLAFAQRHAHQTTRGQRLLAPITQWISDLTVRRRVNQHRQQVFQAVPRFGSIT